MSINLTEGIELYSAKTASTTTSFSERFFIEQIRRGNIPVIRIGRSVRIQRQDLINFLEARVKDEYKEEVKVESAEVPKRAGHVYKSRKSK